MAKRFVWWTVVLLAGSLAGRAVKAQSANEIATGLNYPDNLLVDGNNIYFTDNPVNDGLLKSVLKTGGAVSTLVSGAAISDSGNLTGISLFTTSGQNLYGGFGGYVNFRIFSAPKTGGAFTILQPVDGGGLFIGAAGSQLYYGSSFSKIHRMAPDGTGATEILSGNWVRSRAIDEQRIYFVEYFSRDVRSFDLATSTLTTLISGNPAEGKIFIDQNNLYFDLGGTIRMVPKGGGTIRTLVSGTDVWGYVSDGDFVYFLENEKLKRIDPLTGEVTDLWVIPGADSTNIASLAVDDSAIYWADRRGGRGASKIFRLAKPGPPTLDHFEISSITSPQTVGTAVPVTVTARSATGTALPYTGEVFLTASAGQVSPISVTFTGQSTKSLSVRLDSPGLGVRLRAMGGGAAGESATFEVTGGTVSTGRLAGNVVDQSGAPLNGAAVTVTRGATQTTIIAVDGKYFFDNLPCGEHTLAVEHAGNSGEPTTVQIQCGVTTTRDLVVDPGCPPAGLTPILLVPGILGSTMANNDIWLPSVRPDWNSEEWPDWGRWNDGGLVDLLGRPGWRKLVDELKQHGYKVGCNLFPVPYDWRVDLIAASRLYLKKWIDKARNLTNATKVNIIAHSMGGLVTRAYIQSAAYAGDIDKFAMVGTPNRGAPILYYMWEGGDPLKADLVSASLSPGIDLLYVYNLVSSNQYNTFFHGGLLTRRKLLEFYHNHMPGLADLLPAYDVMVPEIGENRALACETNSLLLELNDPGSPKGQYRGRMVGPDDPAPDKVKTKVFYGTSSQTLSRFLAGAQADPCSSRLFYPDGHPLALKTKDGDGTVPAFSAISDFVDPVSADGVHAELIGVFTPQLVSFMVPTALQTLAAGPQIDTTPTRIVSLWLGGRTQPLVMDAIGKASGIDPTSGALRDEIPDSTVDMNALSGSVVLRNPADGTYTVRLKSPFDEDYPFQIEDSGADHSESDSLHGFSHAGVESAFQITVTSSGITVQRDPSPPSALVADLQQSGESTGLSWQASPTAGVSGYNIYSKLSDEPSLVLITTVAGTSFQTSDAWAADGVIPLHLYAVSAVMEDGHESFLSNTVENNDRDHDGLTDQEETEAGTQLANPDSDGDGLNDGTEALHGTAPLLADTDGDGYSDGREVTAGSDPLDATADPSKLPLDFYTVPPCRALDTRLITAPLVSGTARIFPITASCGIPPTAIAISANVTVISPSSQGNVRLYPGDIAPPQTSTLNFRAGQVRANNATLLLTRRDEGTLAALATFTGVGPVDLVIDVNGYFQ